MNSRHLWEIQEKDYQHLDKIEDQIAFIAQYGELAPSRYNTQPWKIEIQENQLNIHLDTEKHLASIDPYDREMYISAGCLIANIQIAAEHFNLYNKTLYFTGKDNDNLVASMIFFPWKPIHKIYPADLFAQITKRHSNRSEYEFKPIEANTILSLATSLDWIQDMYLHLTDDVLSKQQVRNLAREANIRQHNAAYFNEEAAMWTGIDQNTEDEGIPVSSLTVPFYIKPVYSLLSYYGLTMHQAEQDAQNIVKSPLIGVLLSENNNRMDWIITGIAFEVLFLRATALGLQCAPITSVIEIDQTKEKLMKMLRTNKTPQMFFRLGYGKPAEPTPRNPEITHRASGTYLH